MTSMTDATWKKYLDALDARYPGPRRYKKWKMAGCPPLTAEDEATCGTDVPAPDGPDDDSCEPCGKPSRFIVERSDGDESWGSLGGGEEACEQHLEEAVCGMIGGDEDVRAVVTLRWDRGDEPPHDAVPQSAVDISRLTVRQRGLILRSLAHSANHTYLQDEAEYLELIRLLGLEDE